MTDEMISFGIIIPVFDSEDYLNECLDSVIKQDYSNFEVLLINDNSNDKSGRICNHYSNIYKNINTVHFTQNRGVSFCRNHGINSLISDYIIFLDSDDYLFDNILNNLSNFIKSNTKFNVIVGRHKGQYSYFNNDYFFNQKYNKNLSTKLSSIAQHQFHSHYCWQFVIKRDFLNLFKLRFIDVKITEDIDFVARLLCFVDKLHFCDEILYWRRSRENSLSKVRDINTTIAFLKVIENLAFFCKTEKLNKSKVKFLISRIKYLFGVFNSSLTSHNDKEIQKLSKLTYFSKNNFSDICGLFTLNQLALKYGAYQGLILYKNFIYCSIIDSLQNLTFKKLFVFCVGEYSFTTINVLKSNGHNVNGLLDNNSDLWGKKYNGITVYNPDIIDDSSLELLDELLILICNENIPIFRSIKKQLINYGIVERNILHIQYDKMTTSNVKIK